MKGMMIIEEFEKTEVSFDRSMLKESFHGIFSLPDVIWND